MKIENKQGGNSFNPCTTKPIKKDSLKVYHKLNMLIDLFINECHELSDGKTATDYHCSNGNQYLIELEYQGLITRAKYQDEIFKRAYISDEQFDTVMNYFSNKGIDILKLKDDFRNKKYTA